MMGHLDSFSALGGGNLNKNFPKIQMPGGLPEGMLKLRFDWYIMHNKNVLWVFLINKYTVSLKFSPKKKHSIPQ